MRGSISRTVLGMKRRDFLVSCGFGVAAAAAGVSRGCLDDGSFAAFKAPDAAGPRITVEFDELTPCLYQLHHDPLGGLHDVAAYALADGGFLIDSKPLAPERYAHPLPRFAFVPGILPLRSEPAAEAGPLRAAIDDLTGRVDSAVLTYANFWRFTLTAAPVAEEAD